MSSKVMQADGRVYFHCPGCDSSHMIVVDGTRGWTWNGNERSPTFSPSVLSKYRHPTGHTNNNPAPHGYDGPYTEEICHVFVTDGRIQFLNDCTHALAGQTVEIPDWD